MHSTQAVRVMQAADRVFGASVVALVACPVGEGVLPAWWVLLESDTSCTVTRAIDPAGEDIEREVWFDCSHYGINFPTAFALFSERVADSAVRATHAQGSGEAISFDHSDARPAEHKYGARV